MKSRRQEDRSAQEKTQCGYVMGEYVVVSLGLLLTLLAAFEAVDVLLVHHQRASDVMQLPL